MKITTLPIETDNLGFSNEMISPNYHEICSFTSKAQLASNQETRPSQGFSYQKFFRGNTIMVIIPHEDDEINIAGAVIRGAREEGLQVICVFITNGDYKYIPDVRLKEAIRALSVLGVPKKDIIFLGYPDGGPHGEYLIFQNNNRPIIAHGRTQTRGGTNIPEFCLQENHIHHNHTWQNLLDDLQNVILKYSPASIIAIDWDRHPDHRMCSIAFDQAMRNILARKDNTYFPLVLKAFAYISSFNGPKDFYQNNLLSSKINYPKLLHAGQLDNPCFIWEKRIRLPVPKSCRVQNLGKNKIFQALTCHMSQKAVYHAEQIINGDQVFWEKRTQNLCFQGLVSVSSGNGKYLHDFCTINTSNAVGCDIEYTDYLWIPEEGDSNPWCRCEFKAPKDISASVFHRNIENTGRILKGRLKFSTGYQINIEFPSENRGELYVNFPPQKAVWWVQFDILERESIYAGLSEWELLPTGGTEIPLLKICMNDEFTYDWMIESEKKIQINAYNPSGKNLQWFIDGQPTTLQEINMCCKNLTHPILVRVEWKEQPNVWDESVFSPASPQMQIQKKMVLLKSRLISWWEKQKEKRPHHALRKFQQKL